MTNRSHLGPGGLARRHVIAICGSLSFYQPLSAQATQLPVSTTNPAVPALVQPLEQQISIPANTEVVLRLGDDLTSKGDQAKVGQSFRLTVAYDVRVNGVVAIPSGTPAVGEVTMRTGKGVFGKSGKLEVEMRRIDLNGQLIPVSGRYRQEGEGNTMAAVGAVFLSAPLLFVTGKSAFIPRGKEFSAYTLSTVSVTPRRN